MSHLPTPIQYAKTNSDCGIGVTENIGFIEREAWIAFACSWSEYGGGVGNAVSAALYADEMVVEFRKRFIAGTPEPVVEETPVASNNEPEAMKVLRGEK